MRIAVFDIETSNEMLTSDPTDLDISVVGIWDGGTNTYHCFEQHEFPALWKILERTDILVGYNSDHFDIPILNKYYPGDLSRLRSLDLMKEIYEVLGRRLRLDAVAEGTLGKKKIGHGAQAHVWWRQGLKDQVKEYCLKDVELTKDIFEYALAHNAVKYRELSQTREIKLNTTDWLAESGKALTHTLGL